MPKLNVSYILNDLMFSEYFTLMRRARTVEKGLGKVTETPVKMKGIIQPMNTKELERLNNGDWRKGGITVWAVKPKFEINTAAYLPDEIIFEKNRYMVISVQDWSHYGAGYMQVSALLVLDEGENGYDAAPAPENGTNSTGQVEPAGGASYLGIFNQPGSGCAEAFDDGVSGLLSNFGGGGDVKVV